MSALKSIMQLLVYRFHRQSKGVMTGKSAYCYTTSKLSQALHLRRSRRRTTYERKFTAFGTQVFFYTLIPLEGKLENWGTAVALRRNVENLAIISGLIDLQHQFLQASGPSVHGGNIIIARGVGVWGLRWLLAPLAVERLWGSSSVVLGHLG